MTISRASQLMLFWVLFLAHWLVLAFLALGALIGFITAMSATLLLPAMWQTAGLALAHERRRAVLMGQANVVLITLTIFDVCAIWMFV